MPDIQTTILIADDHHLVRDGIKRILVEQDPSFAVIEAQDGQEAVEFSSQHKPQVALLDLEMPLLTGLEAAEQIKKKLPQTSILLLTQFDAEDYLFEGFQKGISGYLLKNSSPDELLFAIKQAKSGKTYIAQGMTKNFVVTNPESQSMRNKIKKLLSRREIEVLQCLQKGLSSREIAETLCISQKTFYTHKEHIIKKLKLSNSTELNRLIRTLNLRGL
jgi:DNA-binding NarL/FixJ family response regulator